MSEVKYAANGLPYKVFLFRWDRGLNDFAEDQNLVPNIYIIAHNHL